MAATERKIDWVKYIGLLGVALLFLASNWWVQKKNQERKDEWERANAAQAHTAGPEAQTAGPAPASGQGPASQKAPQEAAGQTPAGPGEAAPAMKGPGPVSPQASPPVQVKSPQAFLDLNFHCQGATLERATLAQEKLSKEATEPGIQLLAEVEEGVRSLALVEFELSTTGATGQAVKRNFTDLEQRIWKLEEDSKGFQDEAQRWTVAYSTELGEQRGEQWVPLCRLTKTFRLGQADHHLDLDLAVENLGADPLSYAYRLRGPAGILFDAGSERDLAGLPLYVKAQLAKRKKDESEPTIETVYADNLAKEPNEVKVSDEENCWATLHNRFFMVGLIARQPGEMIKIVAVPLNKTGPLASKAGDIRYPKQNIAPLFYRKNSAELRAGRQKAVDSFALYLGPAHEHFLNEYEPRLGLAQPAALHLAIQYCDVFYWRWPKLDWLAGKLVLLFRGIHWLTGSYGLAVILLTLVIKLSLHPLQRKMSVSMHKMQQLQPKMKAIEKKYEGHTSQEMRQKREMEKFDLMRKEGANPAAGCLPVFLQMPIFFALYGTFRYAFEIRQADFLWVKDLSLPDRLYEFNFWPHDLNLLPLIYIALTYYQTSRQPQAPTTDPQQEMQQKMMRFMPVVFGFIFYSMPSGLVLYFAASACFGFLETLYIKRFVLKVDAHGKPLAGSKNDSPLALQS